MYLYISTIYFKYEGDQNSVKIGAMTNVQDHAVINTVSSLESGFPSKVNIGNQVTIGKY